MKSKGSEFAVVIENENSRQEHEPSNSFVEAVTDREDLKEGDESAGSKVSGGSCFTSAERVLTHDRVGLEKKIQNTVYLEER